MHLRAPLIASLIAAASVVLIGCPDDAPPGEDAASSDAGTDDASTETDASEADAAAADATNPDATTPDATNPDASNPDADTPDATNPDAAGPSPRTQHEVALLQDGRVLLTGGRYRPDESTQEESWLFDPMTDRWTPGPQMLPGRGGHTATTLADGRVLIAGGSRWEGTSQREERGQALLFDPTTGMFMDTGMMVAPRLGHFAFLLSAGPDAGKVLIAGGSATLVAVRTLELYDPTTGMFTELAMPMLPEPLFGASMVQLADGNVLISGGTLSDNSFTTAAYIYDATARTLTPTSGSLATARRGHKSTLLGDGRVLISGGRDAANNRLPSIEIFDPQTEMFSSSGAVELTTAREVHAQVLVPGGDVWAIGGSNGNILDHIDVISGNTVMRIARRLAHPVGGHTATLLLDGRILIAGGQSPAGMLLLNYQLLTP